jgi:tRNA-2-methylthio-N6-dimethylallyladenosine synthase
MRKNSVAATVPGQKINLAAMHLAADDRIGRRAEWRLNVLLAWFRHAFHLIKAAAANDANGWCVSIHFRLRLEAKSLSSGKWIRSRVARLAALCHFTAPTMPKFFIKTYGCQMNERDSEQVAHSLIERGYELVARETEADVVLLNTCSVRDMADQKALGKMGMLGQIAKRRPEVVLGFLGCMAQARGDSLLKELPHVDLVVGTQKFHRVADYVDELLARKAGRAMDDLRFSIVDVAEEAGSQETTREQKLSPNQATAFVSIMQGCNMHCTFCIVPQTRGEERSRAIEEIVKEARALVERGVKEITLLGQIVNLYGRHKFEKRDGKSPFVQLLEAIHSIDGLDRLRFTSPHPIGFREDLLCTLAELPKLVEHIHLPLQSGSNRILKAMHRPYTSEKYLALVDRIREARPGIALTTDVIVGFPGETEVDYKQTRDLVEHMQFDNAFIFRYSTRRDTPAAAMPDQIDERIKEQRNHDLLTVVDASARRSNERLVGRDVEILCEGPSRTNAARLMGRTRTNKIVVFEGEDASVGRIFNVRVERSNGFSLYGTPAV